MPNSPEAKINSLRGIPWMGFPPDITTGNIWFVDSGHPLASDNTSNGDSPLLPFATIDYAVGQCTASNGDIIYVMPGHTETLNDTSTLTLDVAGISVVGLGNDANRPNLTVAGTAATSTITISADNVKIKNLIVTVGVDSLLKVFKISANDCTIENVFVSALSTLQFSSCFNLTTTYDRLTVRGCTVIQTSDPGLTNAAANTGIFYIVDSEYVTVEGCKFIGNFETAIFHNKTTLVNHLMVRNCYGYVALADAVPFVLVASATGGDVGSIYITPAAADMSTAAIFGTASNNFFSAAYFGNDGANDQGAALLTAAT